MPDITVHTKPACVQRTATEKGLDKAGIEYAIVDIAENSAARDYVRALGRGRSSSAPPAIGQVFAPGPLSRLANQANAT